MAYQSLVDKLGVDHALVTPQPEDSWGVKEHIAVKQHQGEDFPFRDTSYQRATWKTPLPEHQPLSLTMEKGVLLSVGISPPSPNPEPSSFVMLLFPSTNGKQTILLSCLLC